MGNVAVAQVVPGMQIPYTMDYQITLLAHLALDETFFKSSVDILKLTDFALPACQLILEVLKDYYYQFKKLPAMDIFELHLIQMMNTGKSTIRLTPEEYESLWYVLQSIRGYYGRLNVEYFQKQLTQYLKSIRTVQMFDAYQNKVGQNPNSFISQMARLEKEVTVNSGIVMDNMYENPEPMLKAEQYCRISTGLQPLNARIGGGLGVGEFGMITACPGVGKTTAQLNFMDGANIAGWRTLFITLEMASRRIKYRMQSIVAGIEANYFKIPMPDWPVDMLRRWDAIMRPEYRCYGYATVTDLSKEGHTLVDIDVAIDKWKDTVCKRGEDVSTCRGVYVDWLDMLEIQGMALSKDSKDHDLLKKASQELGRLARKHEVALWTATQGTREADGRQMLNMRHVSGAYHKNDALDISLGIGTVYDPATVQRIQNDDQVTEDTSLTDDNITAIPCNRKLMVNLMKNRDNSPCAFEVYQGPTLKLWPKSGDAVAADILLSNGKFDEHMTKLERINKRKVPTTV